MKDIIRIQSVHRRYLYQESNRRISEEDRELVLKRDMTKGLADEIIKHIEIKKETDLNEECMLIYRAEFFLVNNPVKLLYDFIKRHQSFNPYDQRRTDEDEKKIIIQFLIGKENDNNPAIKPHEGLRS